MEKLPNDIEKVSGKLKGKIIELGKELNQQLSECSDVRANNDLYAPLAALNKVIERDQQARH